MMTNMPDLKLLIFWVERAIMAAWMILMSFPAFGGLLSPFFIIVTVYAFLHVMGHAYVKIKTKLYQKKELVESDDDLFFVEKIGILVLIIYLITGHEFALVVVMSIFLVTNTFYYVLSAQRAVILAPGENTEEENDELEDLKEIKLACEKNLQEFKELKKEMYEKWMVERSDLLGKIAYYEECCNTYNEELYEVMEENRRLSETVEEYNRRLSEVVEEYNRRCINMSAGDTYQSFDEEEDDFIKI